MRGREIVREKEKKKIISKFKNKYILDINEEEKSKNNKKEKSKKSIKKEREKEKIKKEKKEIIENNTHNREKNEQSKGVFITDTFKNEKFIVNKYIKMQKTNEKKNRSKTNIINLKKKIYNTILAKNFEKIENFEDVQKNLVKKKLEILPLSVEEPISKFQKFRKEMKLILKN